MHTTHTNLYWIKRNRGWLLLFIALLAASVGLWLLFDGPAAADVTLPRVEAASSEVALAAAPAALSANASAPAVESAPAPESSELAAVAPSSDNCIACHTNLEVLQTLAEEPEQVHSTEASGEG
ncbi:MAG: hypothetical protein HUU23_04940 [Caldilineales bacterium]|nr:hypothetical protein [Caldilineales bacterium]